MKKKNILFFIIFAWLSVIFVFSNQPFNESNSKSKVIIKNVVRIVYKISKKEVSEERLDHIVLRLNKPLRKSMHMIEYCILTLMLLVTLKVMKVGNNELYLYAIFFCFTAACWDEIHQLYVPGRTGQFSDAIVDTIGGIIALIIYKITTYIKSKKS